MTTNNTLAEDLTEAMQRCEKAYHQMFTADTPGNGKAFDATRAEFARLVAQVGQPALPALTKELERTRNGARILERALEDARAEIDRLKADYRATDPLDLIKNPLTPYGLLVRALRIAAGTTLMEMSRFCGQSPSYMSGIETGRKPLTPELICRTHRFFHDKGLDVTLLLLQQARDARRRIEGEGK